MEILIPGLILVALMVYASTRIKRTAAQAFEEETVETNEFSVFKPEGFLNVLNGDPKYLFEAYTKEFGVESSGDIRRATAHITVMDKRPPDAELTEEGREVLNDVHYRRASGTRTNKGVDLRVDVKEAEKQPDRIYRLEVVSLEDGGELRNKIERMLDSFEIK